MRAAPIPIPPIPPVPPAALPRWLRQLAAAAPAVRAEDLSRFVPEPAGDARRSAVLVLFGEGPSGPDVLLIERAATLREHAGQPAFPGGAVDVGDAGPVQCALREAAEETGLDPAGVQVFGLLPALWLPPSNFAVTPVLGWWRSPSMVAPVDAAEVAAVVRAPLALLTDPARRGTVRHPSGFSGPAFEVEHLLVWGFTAGLLARILDIGGLALPWDAGRRLPLPASAGSRPARTVGP